MVDATVFEIKVDSGPKPKIERKSPGEILKARKEHGGKKQNHATVLGTTLPKTTWSKPVVELEIVKISEEKSYIRVKKVQFSVKLHLRVMTDKNIDNTNEGKKCNNLVNAHEMEHVRIWRTSMQLFMKPIPKPVLKATEPVNYEQKKVSKAKLKKMKADKIKIVKKALDVALDAHIEVCHTKSQSIHTPAAKKKELEICEIFLSMSV